MTNLRTKTMALALAAAFTLSSCGDKEPSDKQGNATTEAQATKADAAPPIPADFYLQPINDGCDKFADLDTTDLLGENVTAIHTMRASTDAACVFSLANDDKETPSRLVWMGIDMETDDSIWKSYETFEESGWWMHETRPLPQDSPWWGFTSYWDWSDEAESHAGLMQLNATDASGLLRLTCEYRGEPSPGAEDTDLIDDVASVEDDLLAFCTDALDHAMVKTD